VDEILSSGDGQQQQYKVLFEMELAGRKSFQSKIFDLKQLAYAE